MPLYRFQCAAHCGHEVELFRRIAERDHDLPLHCGAPVEQMIAAPMVTVDIQPYRSMIDGSMVSGRAAHREHLRANGCIEVGNEKIGGLGRKLGEVRGDFNLKPELVDAARQVLRK